jgi:hypothetical protein
MIIRIYFYGSIAIALVALIAGFFFIDSPMTVRLQKYDQSIVNKLNQIDNAVNAYYGETGKLPENLSVLLNGGSSYYVIESDLTDPGTGKIFEYKVDAKDAYEFCTTFKTENKSQTKDKTIYVDTRWLHDAGYQCLKQRVALIDSKKPSSITVPVR